MIYRLEMESEMGKMSEVSMEIQDLLEEGMDVSTVAYQLNVPTEWVVREHEAMTADSEYDGQPDEAQEWHDFDQEC